MNNSLKFGASASANVDRGRDLESDFKPHGYFTIEHRNKAGELLNKYIVPNGVVNVGKDDIFEQYFRNGTVATAWYIGIVDASGYSAIDPTDTMASHAGWTEFVGYTEANRVTWGPDAAASQSITNSTPVTFSINASGSLKGAFLVDENTKSGTTGILWATALFAGDIPVTNGDTLKITYTVNGT